MSQQYPFPAAIVKYLRDNGRTDINMGNWYHHFLIKVTNNGPIIRDWNVADVAQPDMATLQTSYPAALLETFAANEQKAYKKIRNPHLCKVLCHLIREIRVLKGENPTMMDCCVTLCNMLAD
jgi:hypothetical protein